LAGGFRGNEGGNGVTEVRTGAGQALFDVDGRPLPEFHLPEEVTVEPFDRDSDRARSGEFSQPQAQAEAATRRVFPSEVPPDSPERIPPEPAGKNGRHAAHVPQPDALRDVSRGGEAAVAQPQETADGKTGSAPGNPSNNGVPEPLPPQANLNTPPAAQRLVGMPVIDDPGSPGKAAVPDHMGPREGGSSDPTATLRAAAPPPRPDAFLWQFHYGGRPGPLAFRNWVHLNLQDPALGRMRWQIHLGGGQVSAETVVESARVQSLLQSHQGGLENRLNALNLEVTGLEVSVGEGFHGFSASHGRRESGGIPLPGNKGEKGSVPEPEQVSVTGVFRSGADAAVDVYV